MPYVVLIGPASYRVAEVFALLSEKYLAWRRRRSREALSGWLQRRQQAWLGGESFDEEIPDTVDWRHIEVNMDLILATPDSLSAETNGADSEELDISTREQRILEKEAWFGRKYLVEQSGGTFDEPYPSGR